MGWLGKLLGTDGAVKEMIDTGKELLDDAFYTESEKAEDKAASAAATRGMLVDWMKNTQGQNLSRRVIALSVTATWLSLFLIATGLSVAGIWVDPVVLELADGSSQVIDKVSESAELIDNRNEGMTGAVMLILAFYFAAPKLDSLAEAAMARFSKTK